MIRTLTDLPLADYGDPTLISIIAVRNHVITYFMCLAPVPHGIDLCRRYVIFIIIIDIMNNIADIENTHNYLFHEWNTCD